MTTCRVFVTGATGHLGRHMIPELLRRRDEVRALVRPGSASKLPPVCIAVEGNALHANTYAHAAAAADTFIHLVGVSHSSPAKAEQFRSIELKSVEEAVKVARGAGVAQFVYLSVAQPAPVMKSYVQSRIEGEALLQSSGLNATILSPWYVLGPGRRWPVVLLPFHWLLELFPSTRESAQRLGLVTTEQIVSALRLAVENPSQGIRFFGVAEIRKFGRAPVPTLWPWF